MDGPENAPRLVPRKRNFKVTVGNGSFVGYTVLLRTFPLKGK